MRDLKRPKKLAIKHLASCKTLTPHLDTSYSCDLEFRRCHFSVLSVLTGKEWGLEAGRVILSEIEI